MSLRRLSFKSRIGCKTLVAGFDDYGHVELKYLLTAADHVRGHAGYAHTVWAEPDWIKKV
jgi:hypothetical protein